ncbi:hypothetical protein JCM16303_006720 [Sporobolomyces ruberrimus]
MHTRYNPSNLPPRGYYVSIPGPTEFYAWLSIDDRPVPLYNLESTPDRTTCYVESRAGARFAVHFADETETKKKGFQATVLIDGKWQRGKNISSEAVPGSWSLGARRDSESTERPFVFQELSTTSFDELASTSESALKSLGTVELRYRRIKKIKSRTSNIKTDFDTPDSTTTFHEDSKVAVALAHQGTQVAHPRPLRGSGELILSKTLYSLGPSRIAQFREERQNKYIYRDSKENPFHTFAFCYRSRSFLESRNLLHPVPTNYYAVTTPSSSKNPAPACRPDPTIEPGSPDDSLTSMIADTSSTSFSTSISSNSLFSHSTSSSSRRTSSGNTKSLISRDHDDSEEIAIDEAQLLQYEPLGVEAVERLRSLQKELRELKGLEREVKRRQSEGHWDSGQAGRSGEEGEEVDGEGSRKKQRRNSDEMEGGGKRREEIVIDDSD